MNGQMKKYKASLINMADPIPLSQCPKVKMDLSGLIKYAKSRGVKVAGLTEKECSLFIKSE